LAFETLDEFLQTGTFRVVHPLMMFASRLRLADTFSVKPAIHERPLAYREKGEPVSQEALSHLDRPKDSEDLKKRFENWDDIGQNFTPGTKPNYEGMQKWLADWAAKNLRS